MPQLSRAGWFLCNLLEWGVRESDAGAISVTLKLEAIAEWMPSDGGSAWREMPPADVFGDWYVQKKDGGLNQNGLDQLCRAKLWDFNKALELYTETPPQMQVVVSVEPNVYQGKTTYRPNWLHDAEHIPGSGGIANGVSRERIMELNAAIGAKLRAAAPKPKATAAAAAKPSETEPPLARTTSKPLSDDWVAIIADADDTPF